MHFGGLMGLGQCFQFKKLLSFKTSISSFESFTTPNIYEQTESILLFWRNREIGQCRMREKKMRFCTRPIYNETEFWALVCIICWNLFFFRFNFQCEVPKRKQECFQQLKSQINGHEWIISINSLQIYDFCFCKLNFAFFNEVQTNTEQRSDIDLSSMLANFTL